MERNKEYDAFGPWIYEIDDENDVPNIFRSYYSIDSNCLMLIKVPRKIERAKASPGMDLYDYLISAYDTYLHIFRRVGKKVIEQKVDYNSVIAIKDIHNLLRGLLILYTPKEPVIIEYNTVSEKIVSKLINVIENRISYGERKIQIEGIPIQDKSDSIDVLFINLFDMLQKVNPGISLAAYQSRPQIKKTKDIRQKLKNKEILLSQTAFIVNDKELIVLERDFPKQRKEVAKYEHTFSYLFLPLQSFIGADLTDFDVNQHLQLLQLKLTNQTFTYLIDSVNEEILDLYNALNLVCVI